MVSGLTLQGSFRDGSTDSGREQVPSGVLNTSEGGLVCGMDANGTGEVWAPRVLSMAAAQKNVKYMVSETSRK